MHDQAFTVSVQSLNRKNCMGAQVFVDGTKVGRKIMGKRQTRESVIEGVIVSATVIQPMHFALIKTSGAYTPSR